MTAYVGNVAFQQPIRVGDLVETTARVIATGSSSMHVLVTVDTAAPTGGDLERVAHCLLVLVAVDGDGHPQRVPAPDAPRRSSPSPSARTRTAASTGMRST